MQEIVLTKGQFAQVSDEDYEYLSQFEWFASKTFIKGKNYGYYAVRSVKVNGKATTQYMHKVILGIDGEKAIGDHKDGDTLNNQRNNLRISSVKENAYNRKINSNNKCGYKGVCWNKKDKKWRAAIGKDGKRIHLGNYDNVIDAAVAYNVAANKYFGEFAKLNIIEVY